MDKVYGKEVLEIVISMKDTILKIKNQVMEFLHGLVEIFIKEIIKMIVEMGMDKCTGVMVVFIKDNGKKVYSMEKDKFMSQEKVIKKVSLNKMF